MVSQDSSARNALQTFVSGRGDALIDYENEAITDQQKGEEIEYVIPEGHDPDPEPDRGARQRRDGGHGAEVRRLPALAGRSGDLGRSRATAR